MRALAKHQLNVIMGTLVAECNALFGDKLSDVRLYWSYARGDHNDESDIDIMVILDMSDDELRTSLDGVCRITSELDLKYNITTSPVLMSRREYDMRKQSYGFCGNVEKEGVSLNARQAYV